MNRKYLNKNTTIKFQYYFKHIIIPPMTNDGTLDSQVVFNTVRPSL